MTHTPQKRKVVRAVLFSLLGISLLVLIAAAVIVIPILTHQSAGGSGNQISEDFISQTTAQGEDGRTRELSVTSLDGTPADLSALVPGEELVVAGSGFDAGIGIYVSICKVPDVQGAKPGPCLGGVPEGAMEGKAAGNEVAGTSAWITDDWAWRGFATQGYDDSATGSFEVRLLVPNSSQEGLDCNVETCAITTRADHTAARDRVQDMQLVVAFAK